MRNKVIDKQAHIAKLSKESGIELIRFSQTSSVDPSVLNLIPEELAHRFCVVPVRRENGSLKVAMANPFDLVAIDVLKRRTDLEIKPLYCPPEEIENHFERLYSRRADIEQSLREIADYAVEEGEDEEPDTHESNAEQLRVQAQDAPAIRFVNLVLLQAVQERASDIHIEPMEREIKARIRVDGLLREITPPPKKLQDGITSRIKILGDMDIAERRVPQDGRTKVKVLGRNIDIRISTLPTIYGEKVVMRILDAGGRSLSINDLGLEEESLNRLRHVLALPHGLVLVTGPTGSGKTTTLYAGLNHLSSSDKNIITVEDPVEYRLNGVNQVQVRSDIGLTFAAGLRSILRQDPDILMVGEIRDLETAQIVIRAALTGHLVLSTLHTNDALSSIIRLSNMGVDQYLIASTLNMVIAQRLARRICLHCRVEVKDRDKALESTGFLGRKIESPIFRGEGCDRCGGTGYWGRLAVFEIVCMTRELRESIIDHEPESRMREILASQGSENLLQRGLKLVERGMTTLEEILRVCLDTRDTTKDS